MQNTKQKTTTHNCDLYALVGWPSLHIRRQTHWLQVIYKSLLGKAPLYLSSLVTIAAPTHSTCSNRYISLVTPKVNSSFGRLLPPSQALSTSRQSSSQITAHSPSNLPHPHTLFILLLCNPVSLLAHSSSAHSTIPVFICYIVITSPPWPIYCLPSLACLICTCCI